MGDLLQSDQYELHKRYLGEKLMDKIMYATVKLVVKDSADAEDIAQADYNFEHEDIISTEWVETEEKTDGRI